MAIGIKPPNLPNIPVGMIDDVAALAVRRSRPSAEPKKIEQATAAEAQAASGASFMDKMANATNFVIEIPNQIAMFAVAPIMLLSGAINKVGNWTENITPRISKGLKATSNGIYWPVKFINQSFEEAGNLLGISKPAGKVVQKGADVLSVPGDWLAKKTGFNTWRKNRNLSHATEHFDAAKAAGEKFDLSSLKGVPGFENIEKIHTEVMKPHINNKPGGNVAHFEADLHNMTKILEGKHPTITLPAGTKLPEGIGQFVSSSHDAAWHQSRAHHWEKNVGVKNAPKTMSKSSVGHAVWNASFVGMSAMGMYGTAKTFSEHYGSLKQMYADITGTDVNKVSAFKLLLGSVPAPVAEGRSQLLKSMGVKGLLETIGMVISIKQLVGGHISGKAIGAQIGLAFGGSTILDLTGGNIEHSIVPQYKAFSDAHKSGREIPVEAYAGFLLQASSVLQQRGHVGQLVAMELGKQYAAEKAAPGQIMKEIADGKKGKFMERVESVIGAAEAQHNAMVKARAAHAHPQAHHAQNGHTQKHNPVMKPKEYPVVGKHTKDFVDEKHNPGHNGPIIT